MTVGVAANCKATLEFSEQVKKQTTKTGTVSIITDSEVNGKERKRWMLNFLYISNHFCFKAGHIHIARGKLGCPRKPTLFN